MSKQPWLRCFLELFKADISREHAKDFDVAKSAISNHQSTIGNGTLGGEGFEPPTLSV